MKIQLLALLTCAFSLCAQDAPVPAPAAPAPPAPPAPPAGIPPMLWKVEVELNGKKETLDLSDPATAARLKGKMVVVTEINGQREVRVVDAKDAEKLPAPFPWNEKPPVRTGPVTFLGIGAIEVPADVAAQLTLPQDTGLQIAVVLPDSPAAKAGLQESDIVQKFRDQILITPRQLAVLIANSKEGEEVKLSIIRKGAPMDITAKLGKRDVPHVVESKEKVPQVTRDMVKLEGDAEKARKIFEMLGAEAKSRVRVLPDGTLNDPAAVRQWMLQSGYQPFNDGGDIKGRREIPASEDTGKVIRDELNKLAPDVRQRFIKDLLRESDALPKNALPPEEK